MTNSQEKFLRLINKTGFLFQLRVGQEISNLPHNIYQGRWDILSEYGWFDSFTNKEQFIDLILKTHNYCLIVECKKVQNGVWVFLDNTKDSKIKKIRLYSSDTDPSDGLLLKWTDYRLEPESHLSSFCVVPGQSAGDNPMLERISSEVLRSTEVIANDELRLIFPSKERIKTYYIPVIITNADLVIAEFDINDIELSSGKINLDDCEFKSVPMVRFHKSFSITTADMYNNPSGQKPTKLQEIHEMQERTVLIMNSNRLSEILPEFKISQFYKL